MKKIHRMGQPVVGRDSETDYLMARTFRLNLFQSLCEGLRTEPLQLREFIRQAWPIVEPSNAFIDNWHIDCISEYLEAVMNGDILRLVINIYPRVGKSLLASVLFPVWTWTQKPWLKEIFVSYSGRLSEKFSRDRRTIIEDPWFNQKWGNVVQMAEDQNQKRQFENTARGSMYATSIGGTLTGEGGDLIIIDDGIDPERAESKADRDAAIRFVRNVVSTRLNDPKKGAIVEISQRTHKQDISGTLLAEGGYEHLCLPAIAEKKTIIAFPISKREHVWEEGEALFEARHTKDQILDQMNNRMTARAANAQYRQKPSAEESAIYKRDCWKFYSLPPDEMIKTMDSTCQSWDFSFKDLMTSSFVAGGVWGQKGPNFYLFDLVRKRMGFGASLIALEAMSAKWPSVFDKVIEDKANGPAIIEQAKKKLAGIKPYLPSASKDERAAIVAPYQESGNIYLPEPRYASWLKDFLDETEEFGVGEFKDQVDMMNQAVLWFLEKSRRKPTITGIF